jgi:hypothetical protein
LRALRQTLNVNRRIRRQNGGFRQQSPNDTEDSARDRNRKDQSGMGGFNNLERFAKLSGRRELRPEQHDLGSWSGGVFGTRRQKKVLGSKAFGEGLHAALHHETQPPVELMGLKVGIVGLDGVVVFAHIELGAQH